MRWIVGLGNPGPAYERTRHNAGFMVVDELARRWNADLRPHAKCRALLGETRVGDVKVALLKPQTYMNLSGEAVRAFMDYFKADLDDAIIVYDDMDTEVGRIRLRLKGGPGGHKGIESIIRHTGTERSTGFASAFPARRRARTRQITSWPLLPRGNGTRWRR